MIPRCRNQRDFPAIMSKTEIVRFFSVINNLRDKAMFETVYGTGLRLSEIVYLRVQDIDSKQMRIFVHHGKGGKDRFTLLSERNLEILREYWKQYRPCIRTDICSTPEVKINISSLHAPLIMRLTSIRQWPICRAHIQFIPCGIVLRRICWNPE